MSHEFFNAVKEKSPRTTITELTNLGNISFTRHKDIKEACLTFYKELYSPLGRDAHTRQCEQEILDIVPARITPLMALALRQPLLEQELHRAACALAKDKAPGPDGIVVNFFTNFWTHIRVDFTQMVHNSVNSRSFPKSVTKGLITLISKSGDLKLLNNWRPITLLNMSYKIYAKALQIQLQEPLSKIISPD